MTSHYIRTWGDPMIGQTAALKKLWEAAYRAAQVQAFADAYLVIAVCFAISAMMVPLMPPRSLMVSNYKANYQTVLCVSVSTI
jgi:hypothetical protein